MTDPTMSLKERLQVGISLPDREGSAVTYRLLRDCDDLDALTELLHAAYAPLAAAGMRYVASYQDVDTTRRRVSAGDTITAVFDSDVIGTITLASFERTNGSVFYDGDRPDVMSVGQFAVKPSLGKRGIGSTLLDVAEQLAREHGAAFVGLDTSENAAHLIAFYESRGYRFIQHHRWSGVNYRSIIMAKALGAGADAASVIATEQSG